MPDTENTSTNKLFQDIPDDHWVIPYANFAKLKGIVQGNIDGNFYPNERVSRFEATKILLNSFDIELKSEDISYEDLSEENPFLDYISTAQNLGIIKESKYFFGDKYLFRGEMAEILYKLSKSQQ